MLPEARNWLADSQEDTRKLIYFHAGRHCELCGKKILFDDMTIDHMVAACSEPKRSELRKFLEQINYTVLDITDEMETVAHKIIEMGILTNKSYDDCQHIAAAVVEECNCIIS